MSSPPASKSIFDLAQESLAIPAFVELRKAHLSISKSLEPITECLRPFDGFVELSRRLSDVHWPLRASIEKALRRPAAAALPPPPPISDRALIALMVQVGADGVTRSRAEWWGIARKAKPRLALFRFRREIWPAFRAQAQVAGVPLRRRGRPRKRAAGARK